VGYCSYEYKPFQIKLGMYGFVLQPVESENEDCVDLSQARINWEGYAAGRASGVIWRVGVGAPLVSVGVASTGAVSASASIIFVGGVMGVGAPLVRMGWHPPGLSVPLPPLSSPAPQKSRRFS